MFTITDEILPPNIEKKIKRRAKDTKRENYPTPQPKQQEFLETEADIALFGGAAGSGKSLAILLDFAKAELLDRKHYKGVIFRRTYPEIRNEGGLWDESGLWYSQLVGAIANDSRLLWKFPQGSTIRFSHLQHEKNIYSWQGSQVSRVGFDELTHFTKKQFFYLLTRMRSPHGITPKLRATCNPDAESWLAEFVEWYINPQGYPDPERSGVLRWFIVKNDEVIWADTPQELKQKYKNAKPKSFTFISAKLTDNPALLDRDPDYLANLEAQDSVERSRLLDGNWRVKKSESRLFKAEAINASSTGEWKDPVFGRAYLCGIDPNFGGNDDFCCQIWDITEVPFKLVKEYSEANRSMLFSISESSKIIEEYQPVLVSVERNTGGLAVLERLIELHPGTQFEQVITSKPSKVINTDRIAISLIDGRVIVPHDWKGVDQMRNFSKETREAIIGKDDSVLAWAVAFAWLEEARKLSLVSPFLL